MAKPTGHGGRDYPDFGISTMGSSVSVIADLGELAARLGSPNLYDRQGNTFYIQSWEHGLGNWVTFSHATQKEPYVATFNLLRSPYVIALEQNGTTSTPTGIQTAVPHFTSGILGLEARFLYKASFRWLDLSFTTYDGNDLRTAEIRIDVPEKKLYYRDDQNDWVEFGDLPDFNTTTPTWNFVKLVTDFNKDTYIRFIYNNTSFPLTDIPFYTTDSSVEKCLRLVIGLVGVFGTTGRVLVGDIIVTSNEPI